MRFLNKDVIYILLAFAPFRCYTCKYVEGTDTLSWFCIFGVMTKMGEHLFLYNYQTFCPIFRVRSHNNS